MTAVEIHSPLLLRLEELRGACPDLRFGQLMAILGELSEDATGRGLWDVEDDQLMAAIERFAADVQRRSE